MTGVGNTPAEDAAASPLAAGVFTVTWAPAREVRAVLGDVQAYDAGRRDAALAFLAADALTTP